MSRATNQAAQSQPLEPEWNPGGYLYNASQPMRVTISSVRPIATANAPDVRAQPAPVSYEAACFACHDDHMMRQQHLTRAQWDRELVKMTTWGAAIEPGQRDALLDYLARKYKP
jgi:hypothetical protein